MVAALNNTSSTADVDSTSFNASFITPTAFDNGSGGPVLLFWGLGRNNAGGEWPVTTSAATYNSVSMTSEAVAVDGASTEAGTPSCSVFSLQSGASGSNSFALTKGDANTTFFQFSYGVAVTDADASDFVGNAGTATGDSTAVSVDVTATDANSLIVMFYGAKNYTNTISLAGGITELLAETATGTSTSGDGIFGVAYKTAGATGTITMSGTLSASDQWAAVAIEILPAAGGGGATPVLTRKRFFM